ncbi:DUF2267 domain-containing protein, partial [Streptomyces goshikiensis]|uniref:DUF2267 domain-containing protein n=1 Tax=Streptomyces goshikiensis TaxID=1942 RepID=UPI0037147855
REHSTTSDARGSTTTAHFPAKISYTTQRDTILGRQLTGDERVDLARCLPLEAARVLTTQIPDTQPLTGWDFIKDLATRSGGSLATTRWDTGAVFAAVTAHAGPDLTSRILQQLPTDWALLFGQAELTPAA